MVTRQAFADTSEEVDMKDETKVISSKVTKIRPSERYRERQDGTVEVRMDIHQMHRLCARRGYTLLSAGLFGGFRLQAPDSTFAVCPADGSDEFSLDEIYDWLGMGQKV